MRINLSGRVAIVTGAGSGLGRTHALSLAKRGAKVVVNDLGSGRDGAGCSLSAAESAVEEIRAMGGEAMVNGANVTDFEQVEAMVAKTVADWGRVDILVNNAGILRDRTFAKVSLEDFRAVVDVHFWGGVNCTKAVWEQMREQQYGRVVMTTSSSGLYGNFGQSAYSAAKMALVGLMNTLHEEGAKYNIRVNSLAPSAATRMTEELMSPEALEVLEPEVVSPAILALVAENAPSKKIICAGAGSFEAANITLTQGVFIGKDGNAGEEILVNMNRIFDRTGEMIPETGFNQSAHELDTMKKALVMDS